MDRKVEIIDLFKFWIAYEYHVLRCILFLEPDPNAIPENYLEEVYAVEDYTSTEEGGLSFNRGDRVYVLLRNRGGVCTGW